MQRWRRPELFGGQRLTGADTLTVLTDDGGNTGSDPG